MARVINYDQLDSRTKRKLQKAGYTPDKGGKTATRRKSSKSSREVKETVQGSQRKQQVEEMPVQKTPVQQDTTTQVKRDFEAGRIDAEVAARRLQALKQQDRQRTIAEQERIKEQEAERKSFRAQEKRAKRIEKTEQTLYSADQFLEEKTRKVIKGEGYGPGLGRAVVLAPYRYTAGFAGDLVVAGMKGAATTEGLIKSRKDTVKELGRAGMATPRESFRSVDPRKPEGLVNLAATALIVRSGGKSRAKARREGIVTEQATINTKYGRTTTRTRETSKATIKEGVATKDGVTTRVEQITPKQPGKPFKAKVKEGFGKARAKAESARDTAKSWSKSMKDSYKKYRERSKTKNREVMERGKSEVKPYKPPRRPLVPRRPRPPAKSRGRPPEKPKDRLPERIKQPPAPRPKQEIIPKPKQPPAPKPPKPPKRYVPPRRTDPVEKFKPKSKDPVKGGGLPFIGSFPDFPTGGGLLSGFPSFSRSKKSRRTGYTPSQAAITFNIKGKKPKKTTGLEFRPILK